MDHLLHICDEYTELLSTSDPLTVVNQLYDNLCRGEDAVGETETAKKSPTSYAFKLNKLAELQTILTNAEFTWLTIICNRGISAGLPGHNSKKQKQ